MAYIKKVFAHSLFALAIISTLCVHCVYASLGELAMESYVPDEPIYFNDFSGVTINSDVLTYTPTANNFVALSKFDTGVYQYFQKRTETDGNQYLSTNIGWIKVKDFFKDALPGKVKVSFKVKSYQPTQEADTNAALSIRAYNIPKSVEIGDKTDYGVKYSVCHTSQTQWMDAVYEFVWDGAVCDAESIDPYSLCIYVSPAGKNLAGNFNTFYAFDDFKIECASKKSLSLYAGKELKLTTKVGNNIAEAKGAILITALYDSDEGIKYLDAKNLSVPALGTEEYTRNILIPEDADDTWKIRTYLKIDDGTFVPYSDEYTVFSCLNTNFGFEFLDSEAATGFSGWDIDAKGSTPVVSEDGFGGKYSVNLDAENKSGISQNIADIIMYNGEGNYRITLSAKSENSGKVKVTLGSMNKTFDIGNDWKEIIFDAALKATDTSFSITNAGTSDIFVDDVALIKID